MYATNVSYVQSAKEQFVVFIYLPTTFDRVVAVHLFFPFPENCFGGAALRRKGPEEKHSSSSLIYGCT